MEKIKMPGSKWLFLLFILLLSSCQKEANVAMPGYVEGRYTYITTNFSGKLFDLYVNRGDEVMLDQPLFSLDKQPQIDQVTSLKADIEAAKSTILMNEANYKLQKLILQRRQTLVKKSLVPIEEVDQSSFNQESALSSLANAKYRLNSLEAELQKALWQLDQKFSKAPVKGLVHDTYYRKGEIVSVGTPVLSLLNPDEVKIIFFVPEKELNIYKINQKVEVLCDSCKNPFLAKIVFIKDQAEYTPPVIYSNEVRAKLVYRIEAKPLTEISYKLVHPGQPVQILRAM